MSNNKINYLSGKVTYLCGGMQAYADDGVEWREWIKPILIEKYNLTVIDPTHKVLNSASEIGENKKLFRELILQEKFIELKKAFNKVARFDLRSCDKSDCIIVDYDPNIHSVGTYHELTVSSQQHKAVLLKYKKSDLQYFNPWITVLVHPQLMFSEWSDMFAYLDKINNNNFDEFDESVWTL